MHQGSTDSDDPSIPCCSAGAASFQGQINRVEFIVGHLSDFRPGHLFSKRRAVGRRPVRSVRVNCLNVQWPRSPEGVRFRNGTVGTGAAGEVRAVAVHARGHAHEIASVRCTYRRRHVRWCGSIFANIVSVRMEYAQRDGRLGYWAEAGGGTLFDTGGRL